MKKAYETPTIEVVEFQYREQVVATSGVKCTNQWINTGDTTCHSFEYVKNFAD